MLCRWLRFPVSCAAPVLYIVLSLLAPPSCDIGSKLTTGVFIMGPQLVGTITAGIVVSKCASLARGSAFLMLLGWVHAARSRLMLYWDPGVPM